jgi:hypothetical protein
MANTFVFKVTNEVTWRIELRLVKSESINTNRTFEARFIRGAHHSLHEDKLICLKINSEEV